MSLIKNLKVEEKTISVEYPDIDGFYIDIAYVSREKLVKLRNRCISYKFNKNTRQREETLDQDKFLKEYTKEAIKGWSGLKIKHLPELLAVNISGQNPEKLVTYSEEEAYALVSSSNLFDQFITDSMNDISIFSDAEKEEEEKN